MTQKPTHLQRPVLTTCSFLSLGALHKEVLSEQQEDRGREGSSTSLSCIVIKFYFILPRRAKYQAKYKFK